MRKLIFLFFSVVLLLAIASATGYAFWRLVLLRPPTETPTVSLEIKSGDGASQVGRRLRQTGFLASDFDYWLFRFYLRWRGLAGKIQAGIFEVKSGQSIRSLVNYLINPQWAERELKFIEGWNLRDYGDYLAKEGVGTAVAWQNLVGEPATDYRFRKGTSVPKDFSAEFDFLSDKPAYISLEGYLFPDTYRLPKTADLETVVRRLLKNFGQKLTPDLRAEIHRQRKSLFEVVTMASLIEREARGATDKKMVADVLWRRLAIGMPLQVDASVNYITGGKSPAVSLAETKIDSPYNTYKYSGMPLGPIANPGLESLLAVIYQDKNDYWFFLSDKDGVMHYSKTLDEHNRLKAQYLK